MKIIQALTMNNANVQLVFAYFLNISCPQRRSFVRKRLRYENTRVEQEMRIVLKSCRVSIFRYLGPLLDTASYSCSNHDYSWLRKLYKQDMR